jgi:four helix bundle protein
MKDRIEFIQTFQRRTKLFALTAIRLFQKLPRTEEARIIGKQFLRSSLSVGANYRAVCRARSKAELFAKLSVSVEEADEVIYWIEILEESRLIKSEAMKAFSQEATEILSVLSTARKNAR